MCTCNVQKVAAKTVKSQIFKNDKDGTNLMLFGCAGENEPAVERVRELSVEAQAGDQVCGVGFFPIQFSIGSMRTR
jgi:hypothetical protein